MIDLFAQPCGISLMAGDEINLGGVNQDLVLRGLEGQDVGDIAGRDGVVVRLKLDIVIRPADPQGHFGAVIGMKGQRLSVPPGQRAPEGSAGSYRGYANRTSP